MISRLTTKRLAVQAILALATVLIIAPGLASAAPNQRSCNTTVSNCSMGSWLGDTSPWGPNSFDNYEHVHYLRKSASMGTTYIKLNAYYTSAPGGLYFQVNPKSSCSYNSNAAADSSYITVTVSTAAGSVDYYIRKVNSCLGAGGWANVAGANTNNRLYGHYALPTPPTLDGATANVYYKASIYIRYTSTNSEAGAAKLTVTAPGGIVSQQAQVYNPDITIAKQSTFPIISRQPAAGVTLHTYSAIGLPMGVPCTQGDMPGQIVRIYDADNGGNNFSTNVYARVYDKTTNQYQLVYASMGVGGTNTSPWSATGADPRWFRPNTGEKGEASFGVTLLKYHQYELQVSGIDDTGVANLVSVGLPQDPIFGIMSCPPPTAYPGASFGVGSVFAPTGTVTGVASVQNTQGGNSSSAWSHIIWMDPNGNGRYDAGETLVGSRTGSTTYIGASTTSVTDVPGTVPATAHNGDRICTALDLDETTFSPSNTVTNTYTFPDSSTNKGYSVSCTNIFIPGARPYFTVAGGDIAAGLDFINGAGSCTPNTLADIIGSNTGSSNYKGTGAHLGALALRNIKDFATSKVQLGGGWDDTVTGGGPGVNTEGRLAFSNNNPAAYGYLGLSTTNGGCVPNYYDDASSAVGDLPGLASDYNADAQYFHDGDLTLNSISIPANGQKVVLKVHGNVHIAGNITYQPPANVQAIPQFELIASGDVTIENTVSQIDGFYDAQGGKFITCTDSTGAKLVGASAIDPCKITPLTVNGTVAAKTVIPNRTWGDRAGMYGQSQTPGEIFRYSPQFWLPYTTNSGGLGPWQSVTSLPPIL